MRFPDALVSDALRTLVGLSEELVEVTLRHDPVAATAAGIHDYDFQLPDDAPSGVEERHAWIEDFARRLAALDVGALDPTMRVEHALLESRVAAIRFEQRWRARDPIRPVETALAGVQRLLVRPFAPFDERKEAALARLMAIPAYLATAASALATVSETLRALALDMGRIAPGWIDETTRALMRHFPGERERIEHAGGRARMGLLRYQDALERHAVVAPEEGVGGEAFDARLEDEHRLDLDAAALERLGREALESAGAALEAEAKRLDPSRSWQEHVAAALVARPEPLRVRKAFVATLEHLRAAIEGGRIAPTPEVRLDLAETPAFERAPSAGISYLPLAPFDHDPRGVLYVTGLDPAVARHDLDQEEHADALRPLATAREAARHLQHALALGSPSRLRRLSANWITSEGWALVAQELAVEEGVLDSPTLPLTLARERALAACRAIVDVELHRGRATAAEAVTLMMERCGITRARAEATVRTIVRRPTWGVAALAGRDRIVALKNEARARAGDRFDLREFHAALLGAGMLPPDLLRDELGRSVTA